MKKNPVRRKKGTSAPQPARKALDENFVRLLLNANPLPAFLTDIGDLHFIEVNDAAVNKYGYTRAEFKKMKLFDIQPNDDVPQLIEHIGRHKGGKYSRIWRHTLKSGEIIDVEITAHRLPWNGGTASLSIAHDVSQQRRIESALKGAQEELSEVVSNAPIVLFLCDREGRLLVCEGKGLSAWGLKSGEAVGRSIYDFCKDNPRGKPNIRRALAGESFKDTLDLAGVMFETHYAPHYDERGNIAGVIGTAHDVTERRRADVLLHQQAAAIRASMDGMAVHDEEGRFIYLNDAHARLYGYDKPEDLIGRSWKDLYTAEELKRFEKSIMPAFWKEGSWRGEAIGRRQDGSTFPQEVCLIRIEGGGLVCVARDITERRRAEKEHDRLLSLEKSARAQAEAASRAKDEFLAVVSHELRTPMTAILGWTWLVRSEDVSPAERNRALEIIERNMKLQAQIIEDLLDLSSIVTGKLHLDVKPVELGSVLRSTFDTLRSAAQAKSVAVAIECDQDLSVYGDHYRLQQIFWNLLSNAVKFNREGGGVTVQARLKGGCAMVSIEDQGSGIEPDFLVEVFDLFRQGENSLTRQHRGLGIGLAIVRHLVEMHGGTVSASSGGVGKGATFTVTLPLSQRGDNGRKAGPPAVTIERQSKLAGSLDGLNILVVDDEHDTLQMLAELLRHCGATVAAAPSAQDALEELRRQKPQVMIADIAMPIEDGYSLIRKVRALPKGEGAEIPALALTARAKREDRELAMRAGFDMYLAKPVEPADLVTTVRNLVAERGRLKR